jgi:Spy/CpxP family protein refolding chaperone
MLRRSLFSLITLLFAFGTIAVMRPATAQKITSPRLDAAAERLATTLDLSPAATEQVRRAMARHEQEAAVPGLLWHVAADLQNSLTPEAKAAFLDAAVAAPPMRGPRAQAPRGRWDEDGRRALRMQIPDLTEVQRAEIAQIRASYADSTRALRQQRRAAIAEVLTDEQEAALQDRFQQRRDLRQDRRAARYAAFRANAAEVLDLTDQQQVALDALRQGQREKAQALREQVRSGDLTFAEAADERAALREEGRAARADILTPEQLEMVEIHRVLARNTIRANRPMHRSPHRGRRGGPRH